MTAADLFERNRRHGGLTAAGLEYWLMRSGFAERRNGKLVATRKALEAAAAFELD